MQTVASSQTSVVQTQDSIDSTAGVTDAPIVNRFAYRVVKRALDIAGAGLGLLILPPFLLMVGLLVKLTSPGSVFYPWDVIGRGGRPFRGYKFRTMVQNPCLARLRTGWLLSTPTWPNRGLIGQTGLTNRPR